MYRFDYRSGYPRFRHRRRGFRGFPWWLFFAFFWVLPNHLWGLVFAGFLVLVIIAFISHMNSRSQGMNQAQPYYQPTPQPGERAEAEQLYYQPYQQGYQYQAPANHEGASHTEKSYERALEQAPEQVYEDPYQPKAEYPQQMPPM